MPPTRIPVVIHHPGALSALAALLLSACTTAPAPAGHLAPVGPALDALARQLIEPVERESNCRYRLLGRSPQRPGARIVILELAYRGPEVECRQGVEQLNRAGAAHGVAFEAGRVHLARAAP